MDYVKQDWRDIFQSLRIALDFRKMFLGFAILATLGIGFAIYSGIIMYQVVDDYNTLQTEKKEDAGKNKHKIDKLGFDNRGFFKLLSDGDGQALQNAYFLMFEDLGFKQTKKEVNPKYIRTTLKDGSNFSTIEYETVYEPRFPHHKAKGFTFWRSVTLVILFLIVWFFISRWAGAISRIAIVEFAKDERIEMGEALDYAKKNAKSLFWAPIALIIFFVILFLAIALWGLVGRIPWLGPVLNILTLPLVLIAGFLMGLLVFGGIFSLNLYPAAVAAEATDSFDALSRSYSYFFSKPFKTLWYNFVQLVFGIACIGFIWILTGLVFYFISWAAGFGMGENWDLFKAFITLGQYQGQNIGLSEIAENAGFFPALLSFFMGIVVVMIGGLAISYVVSYKMTSYAIVYLLLRLKVDGTDMTDINYEDIDFIQALEDSAKDSKPADEEKKEETKDQSEKTEEKEENNASESENKEDESKNESAEEDIEDEDDKKDEEENEEEDEEGDEDNDEEKAEESEDKKNDE